MKAILGLGLGGAFLAAAVVVAQPLPANAEITFKDKRLTALIASRPGDGTDVMMRLLGRMFEKYLPGKPKMLYRNMPAGAGIKALNYVTEKVKPDGLLWVGASGSSLRPEVLRKKASRFNPRELRMFGGLPAPGGLLVMHKDAVARLHDKSKPPVIMGGVGGNRSSNQIAIWGPAYLGWNMRWVIGYPGTGEMTLAFERGETQAYVTYNNYILEPMKQSGKYAFIAQVGYPQGGKFVKRPDYADVPLISELVKPKLSGLALEAFKAWELIVQGGKWYGLPPKTPDAVLKVYSDAYLKAVEDPEYKTMAKKQWSPYYSVSTAKETQELAIRLTEVSDNALDFIETLKRKVGIPPQMPGLTRLRTTLLVVKGNEIQFKRRKKTIKSKVNAETRITVAGKSATSAKLKKGMRCEVLYRKKGAAASINC